MRLRQLRMRFTVYAWPARERLSFEQARARLFREKWELLERFSRA